MMFYDDNNDSGYQNGQNFPINSYTCSIHILYLDNDIKQKASKFSLDLVHIDVTRNASDDCYLFHDKKQ